jgi:hypothetical protein
MLTKQAVRTRLRRRCVVLAVESVQFERLLGRGLLVGGWLRAAEEDGLERLQDAFVVVFVQLFQAELLQRRSGLGSRCTRGCRDSITEGTRRCGCDGSEGHAGWHGE